MSLHSYRPHVLALVLLLVAWWSPAPALTTALAASAPGESQDAATHPPIMEQAAAEVATAKLGPLRPYRQAATVQPAVGGASNLAREVFGFAYTSSLSDPTVGYPSWNFDDLSTVAIFGLHINSGDGHFVNDSGLAVWNSSQVGNLVSTAHAHGTKVVVTIILQDFSSGTPQMCNGLDSISAPTTITNTVSEVRAKGVDGVNVDYEGLNGNCGGPDSSWARRNFTAFVQNLRTGLGGASYISVDTYASSAGDPYGFFDVPGIAAAADSLFVMGYDMEYSNQSYAPMSCPGTARLRCLGPTAPLTGYRYNDTDITAQYAAAIPASKVILGVPYYGRKACVGSTAANAAPSGAVAADGYLDAAGEAGSPYVQPGSYAVHHDANDPAGAERWDTWYNTQLGCVRDLYWDDAVSLGKKYDLVNQDNLRGVGIWTLSYGGSAPELWSSLAAHFAGWTASFDFSQAPTTWVAGQTQTFLITVTNSGTSAWPHATTKPVELNLHFATSTGGATNYAAWLTNQTFPLPADVPPGGSAKLSVTLSSPQAGSQVLEAEMFKQGDFWFPKFASINVTVAGQIWSAAYDLSTAPLAWVIGVAQTFSLTITNTGNSTWPHGTAKPMELNLHFATSAGGAGNYVAWLTNQTFALPADVPPGGSLTVSETVNSPRTGHQVLEAEMFKAGDFWLAQFSSVNVSAAAEVWSAGYDLSGAPAGWVAGQAQTLSVKVSNTGNVNWPSGGPKPMMVNLHFATSTGGAANYANWLTNDTFKLAADIPPGGNLTLVVTVTSPRSGSQVLEAEMFKLNDFWLAQFASVNVTVAAPQWSASYNLSGAPGTWQKGTSQTFNVTVTNTGNIAWPHGTAKPIELNLHFATSSGGAANYARWVSNQTFALPADVAPGASLTVSVMVVSPAAGSLVLEAEMFKLNDLWFTQFASVPVTVA